MILINNFVWLLLIKIVLVYTIPLSPGIIQSIPIVNTLQSVCGAPDKLSYASQDSTSNIGPYLQGLSEQNSNCPCQHIEEVSTKISQLVHDNILNNPTVQEIINPTVQNEIQLHGEVPNNTPTQSPPSVINNYIIIPPEAFKNQPKLITKRYSEPKPRRNRRKSSKTATTNSPKSKHDNVVTEKRPKCKDESKKSNIKVTENNHQAATPKNRNNDASCNCQAPQFSYGTRNENNLLSFCDFLDVLKEYKCCPENRLIRNVNKCTQPVEQCMPTSQTTKKREEPKTPKKLQHFNPNTSMFPGAQQMPFPNFAQYYTNPNNFFNYPQLFGNIPHSESVKSKNTPKLKSSPIKTLPTLQTQTRIKPNTNNRAQKVRPTVILNVKIDNGTIAVNTSNNNSGNQKEIHITLSSNLNKSKVVENVPVVNQTLEKNKNLENNNYTTTTSPVTENVTDILEVTPTTLEPTETIELMNSTEIIETKTLEELILNSTNTEKEETTSFNLLAKYEENISVPELGSEDELPNIEANDLMEDYYPDFHNDNKAYLERSISNKEESKKLENLKVGLKEIPRILIKNRNYYKIQKDDSIEDDKSEKILLPKSLVTTTTVKTLDDSRSSSKLKNIPEKAGFITPPTLTNIDFETKQINRRKHQSPKDDVDRSLKPEVAYKGSTYSVTKTPQYSIKLKPNEELKLTIIPKEYVRKQNIETVFANSKVVNYGIGQDSMEDTVERPIEEYSEEIVENSSKSTSDGPFLVIAKSIGNEDELW